MGVLMRGLDMQAGFKRDTADRAARAEAEAVIQRWNDQLALGRDMLWSPTIRAVLIGGTPWPWRPRRGQARPLRHAAPDQPFGALPIEAKLVEDGIGLVDAVRVPSVMQHRQSLSGAGAAFHLLPVEELDHGLLRFSLSSSVLCRITDHSRSSDRLFQSLDRKSAIYSTYAQDISVLSVIRRLLRWHRCSPGADSGFAAGA
jgi:hypothetical protein